MMTWMLIIPVFKVITVQLDIPRRQKARGLVLREVCKIPRPEKRLLLSHSPGKRTMRDDTTGFTRRSSRSLLLGLRMTLGEGSPAFLSLTGGSLTFLLLNEGYPASLSILLNPLVPTQQPAFPALLSLADCAPSCTSANSRLCAAFHSWTLDSESLWAGSGGGHARGRELERRNEN